MKDIKFKKPWQVKLEAIKRILKNDTFAILTFENVDKDTGFVEGCFSKGFTKLQIKTLLDTAQSGFIAVKISENCEPILEEAKQILNS